MWIYKFVLHTHIFLINWISVHILINLLMIALNQYLILISYDLNLAILYDLFIYLFLLILQFFLFLFKKRKEIIAFIELWLF